MAKPRPALLVALGTIAFLAVSIGGLAMIGDNMQREEAERDGVPREMRSDVLGFCHAAWAQALAIAPSVALPFRSATPIASGDAPEAPRRARCGFTLPQDALQVSFDVTCPRADRECVRLKWVMTANGGVIWQEPGDAEIPFMGIGAAQRGFGDGQAAPAFVEKP